MNPTVNYQFKGLKQTRQPLDLSRVELFLQFETCIRLTTLWEFMLSKKIGLPGSSYDADQSYKVKKQFCQEIKQ